ncbi:MAG: hypothetical protein IT319_16450 [Anaerolineae bacterium]|nr:hypothetical protein [Anaerolineae bacterium]
MPRRNDDLLNEIIQRRRAYQVAQQTDPLAHILDDLNVMDMMEGLRSRTPLCYGPKVIRSAAPSMGVVVWLRPAGYHGYKSLRLVGVWVTERGDKVMIAVGKKLLPFTPPFYDADAYHKLIRKSYDLYYRDDNTPPAQPAYSVPYDVEQRLELRETVAREVAKCLL